MGAEAVFWGAGMGTIIAITTFDHSEGILSKLTLDLPQGYELPQMLTRRASYDAGTIATGTASSVEVRATELLSLDSMSVKGLARFNGQTLRIVALNGAAEPPQSGGIVLHCPRTHADATWTVSHSSGLLTNALIAIM
jgi:hypothetical protein